MKKINILYNRNFLLIRDKKKSFFYNVSVGGLWMHSSTNVKICDIHTKILSMGFK